MGRNILHNFRMYIEDLDPFDRRNLLAALEGDALPNLGDEASRVREAIQQLASDQYRREQTKAAQMQDQLRANMNAAGCIGTIAGGLGAALGNSAFATAWRAAPDGAAVRWDGQGAGILPTPAKDPARRESRVLAVVGAVGVLGAWIAFILAVCWASR